MNLFRYILIMAGGTILGWISWLLALFNINPLETGFLGFLSFYASWFLAVAGTFTLVGFYLRIKIFKQDEPHFRQVTKTFRHGLLFSALITLALFLQSKRLINWWLLLLLILAFGFLETFFLTKKQSNPRLDDFSNSSQY